MLATVLHGPGDVRYGARRRRMRRGHGPATCSATSARRAPPSSSSSTASPGPAGSLSCHDAPASQPRRFLQDRSGAPASPGGWRTRLPALTFRTETHTAGACVVHGLCIMCASKTSPLTLETAGAEPQDGDDEGNAHSSPPPASLFTHDITHETRCNTDRSIYPAGSAGCAGKYGACRAFNSNGTITTV